MVTCGLALWTSNETARNDGPTRANANAVKVTQEILTAAVASPDDLLSQNDTEKALMLAVGYGSEANHMNKLLITASWWSDLLWSFGAGELTMGMLWERKVEAS